jgi:hypothetical protein
MDNVQKLSNCVGVSKSAPLICSILLFCSHLKHRRMVSNFECMCFLNVLFVILHMSLAFVFIADRNVGNQTFTDLIKYYIGSPLK